MFEGVGVKLGEIVLVTDTVELREFVVVSVEDGLFDGVIVYEELITGVELRVFVRV